MVLDDFRQMEFGARGYLFIYFSFSLEMLSELGCLFCVHHYFRELSVY